MGVFQKCQQLSAFSSIADTLPPRWFWGQTAFLQSACSRRSQRRAYWFAAKIFDRYFRHSTLYLSRGLRYRRVG